VLAACGPAARRPPRRSRRLALGLFSGGGRGVRLAVGLRLPGHGRADLDLAAPQAGVDIGEHLIDAGVAGAVSGLQRIHELAGAQGLDLAAQLVELRLAGHLVEAGAELVGHAARLGHPLPKLAQQQRQVLGADHDQGDRGDDEQFCGADFRKHHAALRPHRWRDQGLQLVASLS
jgi:hypothetical protein